MAIKKVEAWQDRKGNLYKTEVEAIRADTLLEANKRFVQAEEYYRGVINVDCALDLSVYLKKNEDWILPMMGWKDG